MPRPARKKVVSPTKPTITPTPSTTTPALTKSRTLRDTPSKPIPSLRQPIELSSKKLQPSKTRTPARPTTTKTKQSPFKDILNSASPVRRKAVLAESTPGASKKRYSDSAFEEDDFASGSVSLKKARRDQSPPKLQVRKTETFSAEEQEDMDDEELPVMSFAKNSTPAPFDAEEESSVDFNYSSSPPRVVSPPPTRDNDEPSSIVFESSENEDEEVIAPSSSPAKPPTRSTRVRSTPARPTTTAALTSLLPRRRTAAPPKPKTRRKAGNVTLKSAKAKKEIVPEKPTRRALRDVTHSILSDIDDLDNPDLQLQSPEKVTSTRIYVDSSAESSPQKPSGKTTARTKTTKTYGRKKTVQEEEETNAEEEGVESDKENSGPSFDEEEGFLGKRMGGKEMEKVKEKFREVDEWGLEFEDVTVSSDGMAVVKGGR